MGEGDGGKRREQRKVTNRVLRLRGDEMWIGEKRWKTRKKKREERMMGKRKRNFLKRVH